MALSLFDLYKIGIGPSSSHTTGPMRAAGRFVRHLKSHSHFENVERVKVELYGSLALTGKGHATDKAVIWGLSGEEPHLIVPDKAEQKLAKVRSDHQLFLGGEKPLEFNENIDLIFLCEECLDPHPNGMRFSAFGKNEILLASRCYFSIGGGFIAGEQEVKQDRNPVLATNYQLPYDFKSADDLLRMSGKSGLSFAQMLLANEEVRLNQSEINEKLDAIASAMLASIERGMAGEGCLPGSLKVKRRAKDLHQRLLAEAKMQEARGDPLHVLDWVNLYAIAVNEENAAGGRVVTAPTNGAAGVIPAVMMYAKRFVPGFDRRLQREYLATAGAIGMLYKNNASISAAEVGCQGEVGVACSMAAGGLTAILGGTMMQVENAAEIGMEHNLGLTCDPIAGLVQIPCIERNTMGAVKAINAAKLAMAGDGTHFVSLDQVIETMRQTGADMLAEYKETSKGGLAVNFVDC